MKVGYCQYDVKHGDIDHNIVTVKTLLKDTHADLIVLPELAFTGYFFENKQALVKLSSYTNQAKIVDALTAIAKTEDVTIFAGMAELKGNRLYNSVFVIDHTGIIGKHRKINLTDNETIFDVGDRLELVTVKNIKVGITICFETWFPESFRILSDLGADLIVAPSNFGGPWTIDVVKVRALENCIPVIMCNRIGEEMIHGEPSAFCGNSEIIDQYGNVLVQSGNKPSVEVIEMDFSLPSRDEALISKSMRYERQKYDKLKR